MKSLDTPSSKQELKMQRSLHEQLRQLFPFHIEELEYNTASKLASIEQKIDNIVNNDKDLKEVLKKYNIIGHIEKIGDDVFVIPYKGELPTEQLRDGYGYKGGVARALFAKALNIHSSRIRDIDIVCFNSVNDRNYENYLGKTYLGNDFKDGYGVDNESSLESYFTTRDITINEVIYVDGKIFFTKQCLLDTVRSIIRLTEYEKESIYDGDEKQIQKMYSKLLRFYTTMIISTGYAEMDENSLIEPSFLSSFWIAVQLDRSFELGIHYADSFVNELKNRGNLPPEISTGEEALDCLSRDLYEGRAFFRNAPQSIYEVEDDYLVEEELRLRKSSRKK